MHIVGMQTRAVQRIADSTKSQSVWESNAVVDGSCGHTADREETIDEGIGGRNSVVQFCISLGYCTVERCFI